MKKILALMLAVVMCLALFAGCGDGKTQTNDNADNGNNVSNTTPTEPTDATPDTSAPAEGKTYNLIVVNHDASTSMCEEYIETLCNQMGEASGGRLTFSFNPGGSLLGATEIMDGVKDGTADLCWSCTSFYSGRFPVSEFIALCGNGITSARMGTDVYRAIYEQIPECAEELKDWKIIALHSCAYAPISTVKAKIETKDDFKGKQLRTAGTVVAKYVEALGATPMTVPTPDVYESVSKGVIDGFCNDWHNIDCFKLFEPIDYCLDLPVNHNSCYVLMNMDLYNSMDDDLKAVIDTFSGAYASDMAGYWWDSCRYWVGDKMRENGVEVYEPSDELREWATSDEIIQSIHQWYIDYLTEKGLDGQAIYDKCMEIVESYKAAHANDWDSEFYYKDWNEDPATYKK